MTNEEVLKEINKWLDGCPFEDTKEAFKLAIQALEKRPQGMWIFKHNSSDIWCSVCNENFDEIPQKFNYCPNCGADMRGNNNENG